MTYDPSAKPKLDGVWRPEPHFVGRQWQPVRYIQASAHRIGREVHATYRRGQRIVHTYGDEPTAQAMCDALNKAEGKV